MKAYLADMLAIGWSIGPAAFSRRKEKMDRELGDSFAIEGRQLDVAGDGTCICMFIKFFRLA